MVSFIVLWSVCALGWWQYSCRFLGFFFSQVLCGFPSDVTVADKFPYTWLLIPKLTVTCPVHRGAVRLKFSRSAPVVVSFTYLLYFPSVTGGSLDKLLRECFSFMDISALPHDVARADVFSFISFCYKLSVTSHFHI